MGRLLGNLKDFPATKLGEIAIRAALERSGVTPDQVQYVIMGQVLQAGRARYRRRSRRGHPDDGAGMTINKVCLSGLTRSPSPTADPGVSSTSWWPAES